MSVLKKIGLSFLGFVIVFVGIGALLPTRFEVERSIEIQAASATIHEYVGDLKKWEQWALWRKEEPFLEVTFGEITTGVGASQSWQGDSGEGSLSIIMSSPHHGIVYDLYTDGGRYKTECVILYEDVYATGHTGEPSNINNTLNNNRKTTKVTWRMKGDMHSPIIGGYLGLTMDAVVGALFEQGLMELKKVVEAH
ncbi:MAG: SRPBCC family protein [Gammaproteobacteria bacterium]|nr:SRPBCC family protein [Gammaproteobacteria bacterium]